MQQAARRNDLNSMMSVMMSSMTATKPIDNVIRETIGSLKYMYYNCCEAFSGVAPKDLDEMIDKIIYLEINNKFERDASVARQLKRMQ